MKMVVVLVCGFAGGQNENRETELSGAMSLLASAPRSSKPSNGARFGAFFTNCSVRLAFPIEEFSLESHPSWMRNPNDADRDVLRKHV
jgi:hypothetical protein